jgi:hypothetical protein
MHRSFWTCSYTPYSNPLQPVKQAFSAANAEPSVRQYSQGQPAGEHKQQTENYFLTNPHSVGKIAVAFRPNIWKGLSNGW